jgi:hypothetical protein
VARLLTNHRNAWRSANYKVRLRRKICKQNFFDVISPASYVWQHEHRVSVFELDCDRIKQGQLALIETRTNNVL